ncbi:PAS domain S-box-containing protein [Desulfonatronum thiosulfatophilum]|uniref:PAS domain S-box-containing protein n=1 Tax=Desulfonatronum thiosulfatophilum TaxID=617002 RepID=A0A1G6C634_9BACT|nr:HlyD family efflux transporter periplasmic adaptor subunit [Desulfonatronum thiosulfatophilum]SDB28350.1 PAS domain S-box-containing protein [Desulfonatronum thiosulfatophilum]
MNPADHLHLNILENMRDGVMALDFQGRITLFNPAAAEILNLDRDRVCDRTFAEVFMGMDEANDEFNQVVLDAIFEKVVGRRETVDFIRPGGTRATLSLTSSYLCGAVDDQARGVILVFSDITALKTLQEQERENNRKLALAYGDLEESNTRLTQALKRAHVVRILATLAVILFFVSLGVVHFQGFTALKSLPGLTASASVSNAPTRQVHTVRTQPLTATISLSGRLQPVEEIVVTAPFDARILENHFIFGQRVRQGDLLLVLDASELEVKLREARGARIKAVQKYAELRDWDSGQDMARARRSVERAENKLETDRRKLEESELLFSRGLIPANELDTTRQQVQSSTTDLIASREDLASTRDKANSDNVMIARMELENAELRLAELENQMARARVLAPASGVVVRPTVEEDKKLSLDRGARVTAGAALLALGDLSGLRVLTKVDEVDIGKLIAGQKVTARGDAFPGLTLSGLVAHISAQATGGSGHQAPTFDVQITIPELGPEAEEVIRVGMSADLEVLVHDNPAALLLPLHLVRPQRGQSLVRVLLDDDQIEEREVQTGMTTLNAVEILAGLQVEDRLVGW